MAFRHSIPQSRFLAATVRGGFGSILKKIACGFPKQSGCSSCFIRIKCPYGVIFESPVPPTKPDIPYTLTHAPHPCLFQINNTHNPSNNVINLTGIVIGRAIEYVPYVIATLCELGRIGLGKNREKYQIVSVKDSAGLMLCEHNTWLNHSDIACIDQTDFQSQINQAADISELRIEFLTPCRLKFDNHLVDTIPFHVLIRALLRRLMLLSYFYGDNYSSRDYEPLIKYAETVAISSHNVRWTDYGRKRFSTRQKRSMILGGVVGSITYSGAITPFMPYLRWGELLQVGKNTSFGNGQYICQPPPQ